MEGENVESKGLPRENVKSFQNLVYKHHAKSQLSQLKGLQEGHLVKVMGSSWFGVPDEGRAEFWEAALCEITAFQPEVGS